VQFKTVFRYQTHQLGHLVPVKTFSAHNRSENSHDEPRGTQAGRGHASDFRDIDYQLVIKSSVETQPKNVGVSTLSLKTRLIINWLPY